MFIIQEYLQLLPVAECSYLSLLQVRSFCSGLDIWLQCTLYSILILSNLYFIDTSYSELPFHMLYETRQWLGGGGERSFNPGESNHQGPCHQLLQLPRSQGPKGWSRGSPPASPSATPAPPGSPKPLMSWGHEGEGQGDAKDQEEGRHHHYHSQLHGALVVP